MKINRRKYEQRKLFLFSYFLIAGYFHNNFLNMFQSQQIFEKSLQTEKLKYFKRRFSEAQKVNVLLCTEDQVHSLRCQTFHQNSTNISISNF